MPQLPPPWTLTHAELLALRVPTPLGDGSASPGDVARLRDGASVLGDYHASVLAEWLGAHGNPRYDASRLRPLVLAGDAIPIYRAAAGEALIWPGAYVTPSRAYAEDHAAAHLGGRDARILEARATPNDLLPVNPVEFQFVPRDLRAWHRDVVRDALVRGEAVPAHVQAEFRLTPAAGSPAPPRHPPRGRS